MTKQPEALRLADALDDLDVQVCYSASTEAAAELRRLHEVNAKLLEVLRMSAAALRHALAVMPIDDPLLLQAEISERNARAATAKVQGETEYD